MSPCVINVKQTHVWSVNNKTSLFRLSLGNVYVFINKNQYFNSNLLNHVCLLTPLVSLSESPTIYQANVLDWK